jgi:hypothetical protein
MICDDITLPHISGPHTQAGLLKAVLTTTLGLCIGAFISQKMAAFLEENELFVPEDVEDDD